METLCYDIILDHNFLRQQNHVEILFSVCMVGGVPPLKCGLTKNMPYPAEFSNLTPDYKPIAVKSKHYSKEDQSFISTEIN